MRWLARLVLLGGLLAAGCASGTPASAPAAVATTPAPAAGAASATSQPAANAAPTNVGTSAPVAPAPPAVAPAAGVATPTGARAATPAAVTRAPAVSAGPLVLTLTDPTEETIEVPAAARTLAVSGRTRPDAVLSVNGRLVQPDASGVFRVDVPLLDDTSLIEVVASDTSGQELRQQIVAVRE